MLSTSANTDSTLLKTPPISLVLAQNRGRALLDPNKRNLFTGQLRGLLDSAATEDVDTVFNNLLNNPDLNKSDFSNGSIFVALPQDILRRLPESTVRLLKDAILSPLLPIAEKAAFIIERTGGELAFADTASFLRCYSLMGHKKEFASAWMDYLREKLTALETEELRSGYAEMTINALDQSSKNAKKTNSKGNLRSAVGALIGRVRTLESKSRALTPEAKPVSDNLSKPSKDPFQGSNLPGAPKVTDYAHSLLGNRSPISSARQALQPPQKQASASTITEKPAVSFPEILEILRKPEILTLIAPKERSLVAINVANAMAKKDLNPELQAHFLPHLRQMAEWPELRLQHEKLLNRFFGKIMPSHNSLGFYYLLNIPTSDDLANACDALHTEIGKSDARNKLKLADLVALKRFIPDMDLSFKDKLEVIKKKFSWLKSAEE